MTDLKDLTQRIVQFRDAREWKQFHTPKDMALSLILEAAEVGELFQWKSEAETQAALQDPKSRDEFGRELADVLYWVLLMAHDLGIDLGKAFASKMDENERKYPVALARGRKEKYTQLAEE